jgi:hypothetical protein
MAMRGFDNDAIWQEQTAETLFSFRDYVGKFTQSFEQIKQFLQHFEAVACNAVKQSVLYSFFMSETCSNSYDIIGKTALLQKIKSTHQVLARFVGLEEPNSNAEEILRMMDALDAAHRPLDDELSILSNFYPIKNKKKVSQAIQSVFQLMKVTVLLKTLFGGADHPLCVFGQFGLHCVQNDSDYEATASLIQSTDTSFLSSWDTAACMHTLQEIYLRFGVFGITKLLTVISFFNVLPKADKVWHFFLCRPEYIDTAKMTYNDVFDEKI